MDDKLKKKPEPHADSQTWTDLLHSLALSGAESLTQRERSLQINIILFWVIIFILM